jgi:hypothetical protein
LATLPFSIDMNNSESSKSTPTAAKSRIRVRTRSADPLDPSPSPTTAPAISSTTTVNYPPFDPFTLMNSPNNAFFPGQSPPSSHTVDSSVMNTPSSNLFRGFPTTQSPPTQYPDQAHLMMYPYTLQQPFASNAPLSSESSGFVNSQPLAHRPYPAGGGDSSRPTIQPTSPSTSQIQSPTNSAQATDPEEAVIVEDKRQRNTAASGSF